MDLPKLRIVSTPSKDELERFYPATAYQARVAGVVVIRVTLDEAAQVTDTQVHTEEPPEMGFAAAATSMAKTFQYANLTGQTGSFLFKIKLDPRD
jgi:TonB family protein